MFHSSQLMPYHTQWQAEPAHQLVHPANGNADSSSSTDVVEEWVSGPYSHARPVHVSVGISEDAGLPGQAPPVPAVPSPPVLAVPKPPAKRGHAAKPVALLRRVGTRAHPLVSPADVPVIAIAPRQPLADSFDDYDEDSDEDTRPVNALD